MKTIPVIFLAFFTSTDTSFAEELTVQNNCDGNIFVKSEGVNSGPFTLQSGESLAVSIDRGASARVWAHAGCDSDNGGNCDTAEGYVSLAEMHWDDSGMTWYDVSQVDGYNLPARMEPYSPNTGGNCNEASCNFDIDESCPDDNKVWKDGRIVACENLNRDDVTAYSEAIKGSCPGVYSWSKDDHDGMRACNPGNDGLRITFC